MNYHCSACGRQIGIMLDKKGKPELFRCPITKRIAQTVPAMPIRRSTPPLPKWLEANDLSQRAKKHTFMRGQEELL
jgi:DNA-directed RNA polymerase subunit RPC12/RpoP